MNEIEELVNRMISEGSSDEEIKAAIADLKAGQTEAQPTEEPQGASFSKTLPVGIAAPEQFEVKGYDDFSEAEMKPFDFELPETTSDDRPMSQIMEEKQRKKDIETLVNPRKAAVDAVTDSFETLPDEFKDKYKNINIANLKKSDVVEVNRDLQESKGLFNSGDNWKYTKALQNLYATNEAYDLKQDMAMHAKFKELGEAKPKTEEEAAKIAAERQKFLAEVETLPRDRAKAILSNDDKKLKSRAKYLQQLDFEMSSANQAEAETFVKSIWNNVATLTESMGIGAKTAYEAGVASSMGAIAGQTEEETMGTLGADLIWRMADGLWQMGKGITKVLEADIDPTNEKAAFGGQIIGNVGVMALTGGVGGMGMATALGYGMASKEMYDDLIAHGVPELKAAQYTTMYSIPASILEKYGIEKSVESISGKAFRKYIIKELTKDGVENITEQSARRTFDKGIRTYFGEVLKGGGPEAVTETLQGALGDFTKRGFEYIEDSKGKLELPEFMGDEYVSQRMQEALGGGFGGSFFPAMNLSSLVTTTNFKQLKDIYNNPEQLQQINDELTAQLNEGKINQAQADDAAVKILAIKDALNTTPDGDYGAELAAFKDIYEAKLLEGSTDIKDMQKVEEINAKLANRGNEYALGEYQNKTEDKFGYSVDDSGRVTPLTKEEYESEQIIENELKNLDNETKYQETEGEKTNKAEKQNPKEKILEEVRKIAKAPKNKKHLELVFEHMFNMDKDQAKQTARVYNRGYSWISNRTGIPLEQVYSKVGFAKMNAKDMQDKNALSQVSENEFFKKWFGNSVTKNEDGTPQLMFHGTTYDFGEFKPVNPLNAGVRGVYFTSPDPSVAEDFAGRDFAAKGVSYWEGGNMMPLYVRAENPFDYENKEHVKALIDKINERQKQGDPAMKIDVEETQMEIEAGKWSTIEDFIDIIKEFGHDGLYAHEGYTKNLGVFNPNQMKSIFNGGEFGVNNNDILKQEVFHGTNSTFDKFNTSDAVFVTTKPGAADGYAMEHLPNAQIYPMDLDIDNLKVYKLNDTELSEIYDKGNYQENQRNIHLKLKQEGFDVIDYGGGDYAVLNRGLLTSSITKDVMFQDANSTIKGAYQKGNAIAEGVIMAFESADVSTAVHELAHHFENFMSEKEVAEVLRWTGQTEWNRDTSEMFARGFEKYLSEGKAPYKALGSLFEKFKAWMKDIYKNGISYKGKDVNINDDIRTFFDGVMKAKPAKNPSEKVVQKMAKEQLKKVKRLDRGGVRKLMTALGGVDASNMTDKQIAIAKLFDKQEKKEKVLRANGLRKRINPKNFGRSSDLAKQLKRINPKLIPDVLLDEYNSIVKNLVGTKVPPIFEINNAEDFLTEVGVLLNSKSELVNQWAEELSATFENPDMYDRDGDLNKERVIESLGEDIIESEESFVRQNFKSILEAYEFGDKSRLPKTEAEKLQELEEERTNFMTVMKDFSYPDDMTLEEKAILEQIKKFGPDNYADFSPTELKGLQNVMEKAKSGWINAEALVYADKIKARNDFNYLKKTNKGIKAGVRGKFSEKQRLAESQRKERNAILDLFRNGEFRSEKSALKTIDKAAKRMRRYHAQNIGFAFRGLVSDTFYDTVINPTTSAMESAKLESNRTLKPFFEALNGVKRGNLFEANVLTTMYMNEREFHSNPNNSKVHATTDFIDAVVNDNAHYNEKDKAAIVQLFEKYAIDAPQEDGTTKRELDFDAITKRLDEIGALNVIAELDKIMESQEAKAKYTSTVVRGKDWNGLRSYFPRFTMGKGYISNIDLSPNLGFTLKSGNLEDRTSAVKPISFDAYGNFERYVKGLNKEFYVKPKISSAIKTLKMMERDGDKVTSKLASTVIQQLYANNESIVKAEYSKQYIKPESDLWTKVWQGMTSNVYASTLGGVRKAIAETMSNNSKAMWLAPTEYFRGWGSIINDRLYTEDGKGTTTKLMQISQSTQQERRGSVSDEIEKFNRVRRRKEGYTKDISPAEMLYDRVVLGKNPLAWASKKSKDLNMATVKVPDMLTVIPMWRGAFDMNFEKFAGTELDYTRLNDENYIAENLENMQKAGAVADRKTAQALNTASSSESPIRDKMSNDTIGKFMKSFATNESVAFRNAILSLAGKGSMDKEFAMRYIAGSLTQQIIYGTMRQTLADVMLHMFDLVPEDDEDKTSSDYLAEGFKSGVFDAAFNVMFGAMSNWKKMGITLAVALMYDSATSDIPEEEKARRPFYTPSLNSARSASRMFAVPGMAADFAIGLNQAINQDIANQSKEDSWNGYGDFKNNLDDESNTFKYIKNYGNLYTLAMFAASVPLGQDVSKLARAYENKLKEEEEADKSWNGY